MVQYLIVPFMSRFNDHVGNELYIICSLSKKKLNILRSKKTNKNKQKHGNEDDQNLCLSST